MIWSCTDTRIELGDRPLVMGILNVTPDSFSDGGMYDDAAEAADHARQMIHDGASIVDVGGESTRPGAAEVSEVEEIRRTIPVVEAIRRDSSVIVSIDTRKAAVARRAIEAGASIVNDVSAMTHDAEMAGVIAGSGAGIVLMHMRGNPRTMQNSPTYEDVLQEVCDRLGERLDACRKAGINADQTVLDPGIGFGKTLDHNLALLAGIPSLRRLGRPVLIGLSRKSFLGRLTGRDADERAAATIAGNFFAAERGADILRVHDVRETVDAMTVFKAVRTWND
jgi:dihydropteroate synthase